MIRITENGENASELTLRVEGRIGDGSVEELERACQEQLRCGKRVRLDFSDVTYVDPRGAAVLRRMTAGTSEVEIINQSALIDDLLQENQGP